MPKVTETKLIAAHPRTVWTVLSDLGAVASYSPHVSRSRTTTSQAIGVGAARRCEIAPEGHVVERVTRWAEGEGYTLEVVESSMPLHRLVVDFVLTPKGDATEVAQSMDYVIRPGTLGAFMGWAAQGAMRKAIRANLDGLATACEAAPSRREPATGGRRVPPSTSAASAP